MVCIRKGAILSILFAALGYGGIRSGQEARCAGTFPITFSPLPLTLDSLRAATTRAAALTAQGRKPALMRVSALVNDSFSVAELNRYGWRLITRIGSIVTLEGSRESAPYLQAFPGVRYVKLPSRAYPVMDSARRNCYVNQLQQTVPGWTGPKLTGKHVLYGLIDTDFDTHHKAFQNDSTGVTRFVAVWDQNDSTKKFPDRYGYGSIANHSQLLTDSLFSLHQGFHGTYVSSMAAGSQMNPCIYYGVAPDVSIAGVAMDTSDQGIINGLSWLFALADSLKLPCVVSMSLGSPIGPHNGTSLVDQVIDSVSAKPGHIVVGAAGNDGDKLAHVPLTAGAGQSVGTWLTPYFESPWYLYGIEMWGSVGDTFTVHLNILDTASMVYYKSIDTLITSKGKPGQQQTYPSIRVTFVDSTTLKHDTVYFPTLLTEDASSLNGKPHLQAEMYTNNPRLHLGVSVTVAGKSGGTVQAWSLFENAFKSFGVAGYIGGDSTMSVTELGGTAKDNITVGAYEDQGTLTEYNGTKVGTSDNGLHTATLYTSRGPTADGRIKPDIMAPGSYVVGAMARDIDTAGSLIMYWPDYPLLDQRYAASGGTSCSAPIVAGIVADMLQADSAVTDSQARVLLQQTATTDAATGVITTPNNLWGAGKANALGALAKLLKINGVLPIADIEEGPAGNLKRLPGNRLSFSGMLHSPAERLIFEYFAVNGRMSRKTLCPVGIRVDSYNSLPTGVYLARVRTQNRVLAETTVTVVSRE